MPYRKFSAADDEMIRGYCEGRVSMKKLVVAVRSSVATIYRRISELGLVPPSKKYKNAGPNDNSDSISTATPPITVGDDDLLRRLREVHGKR